MGWVEAKTGDKLADWEGESKYYYLRNMAFPQDVPGLLGSEVEELHDFHHAQTKHDLDWKMHLENYWHLDTEV